MAIVINNSPVQQTNIKKLAEELLVDRLTQLPNKEALLLVLEKTSINTVII